MNQRTFGHAASRARARAVPFGMNSAQRWLFAGLLLAAMLLGLAGTALAQANRPASFADLAEKLSPAVVNVSTSQGVQMSSDTPAPRGAQPDRPQAPPGSPFEDLFKDFFDRPTPGQPGPPGRGAPSPRRAQSLGSGFIIDAKGIVVTNAHVIADADTISVTLQDNTTLQAELIGRDAKTDIAVLRVKSNKPLPFVKWGDADKSRVGDWVLAIGNPFGLGGSVTAGIISARGRNINAGPYDNFIQTDASINRGNSGGPLFNLDGEVIGINTAIFSPSGGSVGIGFSVPANLARPTVDQLMEFGRTRRGWLGVQIQTVTDEIAESVSLDRARGALVSKVTEGGPAEKGGVEQGDVVTDFDNKPVTDMRALPRLVAETPINKEVNVKVWRKGQSRTVKIKVGELDETETASLTTPSAPGGGRPVAGETVLGMKLTPITPEIRRQFEIGEASKGVAITEVAGDSAAAERGIRPGDVVVEVSQEEVKSPAEVSAKIEAVRKSGRKSVLLLVERGGELRFVALRLS